LNGDVPQIEQGDKILDDVANTLGVLPNPLDKVQAIMYVEGPHDIHFFECMSNIIHQEHEDLPNLKNDERIAVIPAGGGTLKHWINEQYLKDLNKPEFHIYDNDDTGYSEYINSVNDRDDSSIGILTERYEMENYIPAHLYEDYYEQLGIEINAVKPDEDIVDRVSKEVYLAHGNEEELWHKHKDNYHKRLKKRVEKELLPLISYEDLKRMETLDEIKGWFESLNDLLEV
jgi:hypothetical protein